MKKLILLSVILFIISGLAFSQNRDKRYLKGNSKIEQLEKIKLIEALEMNEETTLKFFSRRAEHRKEMQSLQEGADIKLDELKDLLENGETPDHILKQKLDSYFVIEKNINDSRNKFFVSLSDILSQRQISRLIIFERSFKRELKDVILRDQHKRRK
ncbi:MAG: hypothetical protein R6W68_02595 [Ignavibacteriaceae bacterium]